MKTIKLNPTDVISVHFNNIVAPTKMQYSILIGEDRHSIADYNCDINDLETIKGMSFSGHYKSFHENFYYDTFDIFNDDLHKPFELVEIY